MKPTPAFLSVVVLLTFGPGPALAKGERRTHDGFFMRLSAGLGTANPQVHGSPYYVYDVLGDGTGDMNIAVGGIVAPNLAVHGTLWGWAFRDVKAGITRRDSLGTIPLEGTLYLTAFGAGMTYYFAPANAYVSASVGSGSLTGTNELAGTTEHGLALEVTLGKEWWVSDTWGLGLNGGFSWFNCREGESSPITIGGESWSGPSYGLRISATFN